MNSTLEQKIDSLAQTLKSAVSELARQSASASSGLETASDQEREREIDKQFGPFVAVTENVCDYDFSDYETSPERKVIAIVKAPKSVRSKDGMASVLLTVKRQDGKEKLCKAIFKSGQQSKPVQSSAASPSVKQTKVDHGSNESDLAVTALAAVNLERLAARTLALQSFYTFTHAKGAAYCYGVLQPLLAREPFPVGAGTGQRIAHMRGLLVQKIAPEVIKLAPAGQGREQMQQQVESFLPGSLEAYRADAGLRRDHPTFSSYRALVAATGGNVVAQRMQLEREANQPRFENGKWTLGTIGKFENEWLASAELQHEFPLGPKSYVAYRRRMG